MFLALIKRQRHSVFLYRLSFECPTLRLLAGLIDDWQITFKKKSLGVRCAECNGFYRTSSFTTIVMLSFLISLDRFWCLCNYSLFQFFFFFFNDFSLLRYRMVPPISRCSCCYSDTSIYRSVYWSSVLVYIATFWIDFQFPRRNPRNRSASCSRAIR